MSIYPSGDPLPYYLQFTYDPSVDLFISITDESIDGVYNI